MTDKAKESFSWGKYIKGIFNPLNTAKVSAHYLHLAMIVLVVALCLKFGIIVKNWIAPAPKPTATIQTVSGGEVDASSNKHVKNSIFGLF